MLKLYTDLAAWWPLLSSPDDYADEVEFFWSLLSDVGLPASPTLLELGSGGGNNAKHLKTHFAQVTLTDLSPDMLVVSRALNPDCGHITGDMRTLRLGRLFDVVFIHDAIEYMLTLDDLRQAISTAAAHCKPGGVGLFVPDHVTETFEPSTDHGGHDGDGRALRYLEWTHDPDPTDTRYVVEFVYVLREGERPARVEHEQHEFGLFPRADWLRLLDEAGFQPQRVTDHYNRDIFWGRRR